MRFPTASRYLEGLNTLQAHGEISDAPSPTTTVTAQECKCANGLEDTCGSCCLPFPHGLALSRRTQYVASTRRNLRRTLAYSTTVTAQECKCANGLEYTCGSCCLPTKLDAVLPRHLDYTALLVVGIPLNSPVSPILLKCYCLGALFSDWCPLLRVHWCVPDAQ